MNFNLKADRPTIVVGGSVLLIVLFALFWLLYFWMLRQDYASDIESIQPRTARLLGIMASFDQLQEASSQTREMLLELAYPASRDSASTAAAMQQDIRELMMEAGLSISGSQILPSRSIEGLEHLSLEISAEGNIDALDEALSNLGLLRPMVFVKSMTVRPQGSRSRRRGRGREPEPVADAGDDPRRLTVRFQLFSLRLVD